MNKFSTDLWTEAKSLLDKGEKDSAHYLIFESLWNETFEKKNYKNCDEFIKYVIKEDIDSFMIVHILNVLSPKKEEFSYWNEFVEKCTEKLIEQTGEEYTKDLLKVIV